MLATREGRRRPTHRNWVLARSPHPPTRCETVARLSLGHRVGEGTRLTRCWRRARGRTEGRLKASRWWAPSHSSPAERLLHLSSTLLPLLRRSPQAGCGQRLPTPPPADPNSGSCACLGGSASPRGYVLAVLHCRELLRLIIHPRADGPNLVLLRGQRRDDLAFTSCLSKLVQALVSPDVHL